MNIEAALKEAVNIDGALGASLVDWESGMAPSSCTWSSTGTTPASRRGHRSRRDAAGHKPEIALTKRAGAVAG